MRPPWLPTLLVACALLLTPPGTAQQVRDHPDDTLQPGRPALDLRAAWFEPADACGFWAVLRVHDLATASLEGGEEALVWNLAWERERDGREDFYHAGASLDRERGWWFHLFNPAVERTSLPTRGQLDNSTQTLRAYVPFTFMDIPPEGDTLTRTWAVAFPRGENTGLGDWAPNGATPTFFLEYAFGMAPNQQPVVKAPTNPVSHGDTWTTPPHPVDCPASPEADATNRADERHEATRFLGAGQKLEPGPPTKPDVPGPLEATLITATVFGVLWLIDRVFRARKARRGP